MEEILQYFSDFTDAQLKQLQRLNLSHTKITDLGLEHLRPLQNVTYLNCFYCEYVSDGGIAFLKQWENLEYLNLRGTEVTEKVYDDLKGGLPACKIIWDPKSAMPNRRRS